MIVKLRKHPKHDAMCILETPPDLAHTMGLFGPARWSAKDRGYLIEAEQIDNLETFLRLNGQHRLLDERDAGDQRSVALGPLPECRHCGQAAHRAADLRFCPDCGAPWDPVVHTAAHRPGTLRSTCLRCNRTQTAGLTRCGNCGELMPPPVAAGPRPLIVETVREQLTDPLTVGQVLDDQQLPLDPQETRR